MVGECEAVHRRASYVQMTAALGGSERVSRAHAVSRGPPAEQHRAGETEPRRLIVEVAGRCRSSAASVPGVLDRRLHERFHVLGRGPVLEEVGVLQDEVTAGLADLHRPRGHTPVSYTHL